jgi:hypothetical protein
MTTKFSFYRVENVITEESAADGDYASSEPTEVEETDFRGALDALESDCWDSIDERGDGTVICYPADYAQDFRTGDWEASELILKARRPEWADRLMAVYCARNPRSRY